MARGIWPGEESARPPGVVRWACGCRWDLMAAAMWRPCGLHMGEGHLSVLSEDGEGWVARCLRRECGWRSGVFWREADAVIEAQDHWRDTRRVEAE